MIRGILILTPMNILYLVINSHVAGSLRILDRTGKRNTYKINGSYKDHDKKLTLEI